MKNKKLFAILTLVCFMFTLMPVAAFAADQLTISQKDGVVTIAGGVDGDAPFIKEKNGTTYTAASRDFANGGKFVLQLTDVAAGTHTDRTFALDDTGKGAVVVTEAMENAAKTAEAWVAYEADTDNATLWDDLKDAYSESNGAGIETDAKVAKAVVEANTVDVAANLYTQLTTTGSVDRANSTIATVKANLELDKNETGKAVITLKDGKNAPVNGTVYVWAEAVANEVSGAFVASGNDANNDNIYEFTVGNTGVLEFDIAFTAAGTYNLKATTDTISNADVEDVKKLTAPSGYNTVVVEAEDLDSSKFTMSATSADLGTTAAVNDEGTIAGNITVAANGVDEDEVTLAFKDENGDAVVGYTVTIDTTSSAIAVSKNTLTTNYKGEVTFDVSGTIEGNYAIDVVCEDFEAKINVTVGSTAAAVITTEGQPTAPQALYGTMDKDDITFAITDINGNAFNGGAGITGIAGNATTGKYIVLTEKPEKSDLKSKDLKLVSLGNGEWGLNGVDKDAEGTYAVKVILDNGAVATATWEVKKFQTPVMMYIEVAKVAELGKSLLPEAKYVDANGVVKEATDAEFAATGYAVERLINNPAAGYSHAASVLVSADEKYAGTTFTITAVSEKYDLIATNEVKVATDDVKIVFEDKSLEVNVNNLVEWNIVDGEGTQVRLDDVVGTVKYIVLDKPEGAKVSVTNGKALRNGEGEMRLTSNMVGNVTVQAIVQYALTDANGNVEWKYYTGTQIFAVGNGSVGDVVVMSVGSNEIIINDAKATIDAAPIVANNRTFVPFRALAEAFGAEVAYDEATQAVTAELNGTTVVMTIGSATYTVNGVEKTADVAPFINGSRTMVPVRFVAEEFGIKVTPTYDENGATADILFAK